jgi:hypothetical protein
MKLGVLKCKTVEGVLKEFTIFALMNRSPTRAGSA